MIIINLFYIKTAAWPVNMLEVYTYKCLERSKDL